MSAPSLFRRVAARFGFGKAPAASVSAAHIVRAYQAAVVNRLTADWSPAILTEEAELRKGLRALRGRSRSLAQNNDYVKSWLRKSKANIVGPTGIRLQMNVRQEDGTTKDKTANAIIERAWSQWSKVGTTTVCGKLSLLDVLDMVVESALRDGEVLVRMAAVPRGKNRFGFAFQPLEADLLDEQYNADLSNGHRVRMSIEFDTDGRPAGFWLLTKHPGDPTGGTRERIRVPAEEIIHLVCTYSRPSQPRGVPEGHTAMLRLNHFGAYEEAEVVAARVGASKMGFFKSPDGEPPPGVTTENPTDPNDPGRFIEEASPGMFGVLPQGYDFVQFDPQHPAANYASAGKMFLRGASAGLGINYNDLANDLEGVNYSSLRSAAIADRDLWSRWQTRVIEHVLDRAFPVWLRYSMLAGAIALPMAKFDKFNAAQWRPRGWQWVDPLKDAQAKVLELENNLTTRRRILAERGEDLDEVLAERRAEEDLLASLKLANKPATPIKPDPPEDPNG
jgi:lambda family phage portal protein